jgi:hypothetical protein
MVFVVFIVLVVIIRRFIVFVIWCIAFKWRNQASSCGRWSDQTA